MLWRSTLPRVEEKRGHTEPAGAALPAPEPALKGDDLGSVEQNTIHIFERASASVVSVANRAMVRDLFGFQLYEIPRGAGSGFMWDRDGHIISNYHVVHEASAITVTLRDGASFEAQLVGVDPDHDIAVLRITAPADSLVPLSVGTSGGLLVGQRVLAIGNPFGLDTSLSVGVVSALGRSIVSMTQRRIHDVIQTDAAINPGNSGGPLLDSAGRLIGINTAIISPSGAYAGIGFAVPVDTVRRVVPQLIKHGRVRRVGLGIQIIPDHMSREWGVDGVAILRCLPGGAAAACGLRGLRQSRRDGVVLGDILVGVDGEQIHGNDDLLAVLDRHEAGDTVSVTYKRDGEEDTREIVLQHLD